MRVLCKALNEVKDLSAINTLQPIGSWCFNKCVYHPYPSYYNIDSTFFTSLSNWSVMVFPKNAQILSVWPYFYLAWYLGRGRVILILLLWESQDYSSYLTAFCRLFFKAYPANGINFTSYETCCFIRKLQNFSDLDPLLKYTQHL